MSDATYKVTGIVGTSTESIQKAVRNGIARASKTPRNLGWFEVTEMRSESSCPDGHGPEAETCGFAGLRTTTPRDSHA